MPGTAAGSARQSGSVWMTAASTSVIALPLNGCVAVSISYSTHPNAHTSDRLSASRPFACSGLMYVAVPRITPSPVIMFGDVNVGNTA